MTKSTPPRRPDPRIVKSRAALRAALIDLIAATPFDQVTVAAIVARAEIGYATFFRHYPDLEALLGEVAEQLISEIAALVVPLALEGDLAAASLTLTRAVGERQALCRALLIGASEAMRRTVTRRAIEAAAAARTAEPSWLPRDLAVIHAVGATLTILAWWLEHDPGRDVLDVALLIERLVLTPMAIHA